jgi:nucleoside-diphosphate-sugar epimerase
VRPGLGWRGLQGLGVRNTASRRLCAKHNRPLIDVTRRSIEETAAAVLALLAERRRHRLRIKVVRIFNTYGPRMHPNDGRVVSNFIMQALKGEDITIYGDGTQTRSFCYVDDLIEAVVRTMDTPDDFTGPINIGNPREFTMLDLAEEVLRLTGSNSKISFKPLPSDDPKQRQPDTGLAGSVLRWSPKVELEAGLAETIAYFRTRLEPQSRAHSAAADFAEIA